MRRYRVHSPNANGMVGRSWNPQSGQASILLIVILGTFLLASVGFAVDLSSMWFQRQAAQSAADASCGAGAMDMLYLHNATISSSPGFIVGTAGDCSSSGTAAICKYAGFNGFTATTAASTWGTSTAVGAVAVNWTFPSAVTGVSASPGITYPFLNVVVRQKAPTWFIGMLGMGSMTVGASCTCGLAPGVGSPPIVILNPTVASALSFSGGTQIVITGGPAVSVQVNSSSTSAIACSGGTSSASGTINTSTAGPSGTGGQLGLVGGPTLNPLCGSYKILNDPNNLLWKSGVSVVPNPYAGVVAPTQPGNPADLTATPVGDATCYQPGLTSTNCGRKDSTYGYITGIWVGSGTDTCPNSTTATGSRHYIGQDSAYTLFYGNCLEFTPGYYPTGINVQSLAQDANDVTIFQPGVYYLNGDLTISGSNTVRNVWSGAQPSTQGVIFYFLTGGPTISGGSGTNSSGMISNVPSYYLNCSGSAIPSGMPTTLPGNVLVSQCTQAGTYVGAPSADSYSATGLRGLLFFTDPSDTYQNTLLGAGGILNFSGAIYFHNSSYTDQVTLNGAGSSTTYELGNIVVDELQMSGAGIIKMGLTGNSLPGPPEAGIVQ
jgi:putative Flp pilus-assembly TadE/G-like protein